MSGPIIYDIPDPEKKFFWIRIRIRSLMTFRIRKNQRQVSVQDSLSQRIRIQQFSRWFFPERKKIFFFIFLLDPDPQKKPVTIFWIRNTI